MGAEGCSKLHIALMFSLVLTTSCGDSSRRGGEVSRRAAGIGGEGSDSLWLAVNEAGFPDNWYVWPGLDRIRESRPPHGPSITTYLNFLAYDALTNGAVRMSDGATLIVQNGGEGTERSLDVMTRAGSQWQFASYSEDGSRLPGGRYEQDCASCHGQSTTDFILTAPMGMSRGLQ